MLCEGSHVVPVTIVCVLSVLLLAVSVTLFVDLWCSACRACVVVVYCACVCVCLLLLLGLLLLLLVLKLITSYK